VDVRTLRRQRGEIDLIRHHLLSLGDRVPSQLYRELAELADRFAAPR
jgi:hypothetical protein